MNSLIDALLESDDGLGLQPVVARLKFRARTQFDSYEPAAYGAPFSERLDHWLSQVDQIHHRAQLELLDAVSYVDPLQIRALYRVAVEERIIPWALAQLNLDAFSVDAEEQVSKFLDHVLYLPLTDSVRINAFSKFTGLRTAPIHPELYTLARLESSWTRRIFRRLVESGTVPRGAARDSDLGVRGAMQAFLDDCNCKAIVVLEDFIGTSIQTRNGLKFLLGLPSKIPVLMLPLIALPRGVRNVKRFLDAQSAAHISIAPCITLEEDDVVTVQEQTGEPPQAARIRALVNATASRIPARAGNFGSFGFDNAGGLTVLHSNVPDTSLPVLHSYSASWKPLFPRMDREP